MNENDINGANSLNPEGEENVERVSGQPGIPIKERPRPDPLMMCAAHEPHTLVDQFRITPGLSTVRIMLGQRLETGRSKYVGNIVLPVEVFMRLVHAVNAINAQYRVAATPEDKASAEPQA